MENNQAFPFLPVRDIAKDLGVSRQYVHQVIKAQDMSTIKMGNIILVDRHDYALYKKRRLRRDLAAQAGRLSTKLIKTAEFDIECPICGKFAVIWKGTSYCVNNHTGPFSKEYPINE